MVESPRKPYLSLDDLEDGDADRLAIERAHDGVSFEDLDLAGERLHDRSLTECLLARACLDDAVLTGAHLREVRISDTTATAVQISSAQCREVEIFGGRYGALEMYDASLTVVAFSGVRIDYLNLRGSNLTDVSFTDCHIGELDLGDATAARVAFADTVVRDLALNGATLSDTDLRGASLTGVTGLAHLRGATISGEQLDALAPLLADEWGISVG